jgi:hypothetical protein
MDFHPPSGPDNDESGKDGKEKKILSNDDPHLRLIAREVNTHLPFTLVLWVAVKEVLLEAQNSCVPDRLCLALGTT